jgi:hypothetical protein
LGALISEAFGDLARRAPIWDEELPIEDCSGDLTGDTGESEEAAPSSLGIFFNATGVSLLLTGAAIECKQPIETLALRTHLLQASAKKEEGRLSGVFGGGECSVGFS